MLALLTALLLSAPPGVDRTAVLAVHEPPAPDGELTELAHQLRAAATERAPGVLGAPEMRDRLAGKSGGASTQELDRAFGGALAVYQNGELDSAARTLKAIVSDLEELPESEAAWFQWTRAMARLSHVYLSMNRLDDLEATQVALLKADPSHQLDPTLYAPGFRARFEELRQKVRAMPKRRLTVTARGRAGTIYVNGRDVGPTPATVILPAGGYRVGGAAGALRIPSFTVDLTGEDRTVVLDFALAEAFRPSAGPGMLLPSGDRAPALIRAGAWLGVERLVTVSRAVEGGAHFLSGATYDVRRGALLREGSVRILSGSVPPQSLGALSAFLLTGQPSREVLERGHEQAVAARAAPVPSPPPVAVPAPTRPAPPPHPAPAPTRAPAVAAPPLPLPPPTLAPRPPAAGAPVVVATRATALAPLPAEAPAAPSTIHLAVAPPAARTTAATGRPPTQPAAEPGGDPAGAAAAAGPASTAEAAAEESALARTALPDLHPSPPPRLAGGLADPPPPASTPRWRRPAAWTAGVLAVALTGLAVQQERLARRDWRRADGMVQADGSVLALHALAYSRAIGDGNAARSTAWLAGGGAAASAVTSAILFWSSRDPGSSR